MILLIATAWAFSVVGFVLGAWWASCRRDDGPTMDEYINCREPGEFGDGVTVRREL